MCAARCGFFGRSVSPWCAQAPRSTTCLGRGVLGGQGLMPGHSLQVHPSYCYPPPCTATTCAFLPSPRSSFAFADSACSAPRRRVKMACASSCFPLRRALLPCVHRASLCPVFSNGTFISSRCPNPRPHRCPASCSCGASHRCERANTLRLAITGGFQRRIIRGAFSRPQAETCTSRATTVAPGADLEEYAQTNSGQQAGNGRKTSRNIDNCQKMC